MGVLHKGRSAENFRASEEGVSLRGCDLSVRTAMRGKERSSVVFIFKAETQLCFMKE